MEQMKYAVQPYHLLRREVDRLFEDFLTPMTGNLRLSGWPGVSTSRPSFPALNIWENEELFFVEAECPGLDSADIELSISDDQLSVSGERKDTYANDVTYHRRERGTSKFKRTIKLPGEVEADKVEATLRDGVLTLQLPKAPSARPRKIEVRS